MFDGGVTLVIDVTVFDGEMLVAIAKYSTMLHSKLLVLHNSLN